MATSRVDGGLGYGISDIGIVMSAAGLLVLQVHSCFGARLQSTLKASPVRSLRASLAVLLITLILIQFTLRIAAPLEDIQDLLVATHGDSVGMKHSEQQRDINRLRGMHSDASTGGNNDLTKHNDMRIFHEAAAYWFTESSSASLHPLLPSQSLAQAFLPSFLCAVMFISATICSKASTIVLHLALKSSFSSPSTVRWTLGCLSNILGPVTATLIYAAVLENTVTAAKKHLHSSQVNAAVSGAAAAFGSVSQVMTITPRLRYQYIINHSHGSNGTFFISLCASGVVLVYMLSVFLRIQFRGDYGVISDSEDSVSDVVQDAHVALSATSTGYNDLEYPQPSSGGCTGGGTYSGRQYHQLFLANNRKRGISSSTGPADFFAIPTADISALWPLLWQGAAQMPVYGSKLYNLRDDFKDL
jgi:hypothetical protein